MKEALKTALFLAAAGAMAFWAWGTRPAQMKQDVFSDQGQRFFPDFTDPLKATSLEIIEFDEQHATARPFKVHLKDGRWTLPSDHDYPADAKDRLQKTAAAIIDLKKESFRSGRVEDHEALGVIDPFDAKASWKGRGTRVTLRGADDAVLADIIIGKAAGTEGTRYARIPGQARTYATHLTDELSTKFSDWIETDLLKLDTNAIKNVRIDSYAVDLAHGTLKDRQQLAVARTDAGEWKMEGLAAGEELDTQKLWDLSGALRELKIAGVRPKPEGLTQTLTEGKSQMTRQSVASLADKGFYLTKDGLFSNEGEMNIEMKDGVVYTLRFGNVIVGEGEEIEAGLPEKEGEKPPQPPRDGGKKEEKKGKENRYLFVTANFEPALVPEPKPMEVKPDAKPDEKKKAQEETERVKKEWMDKVDQGKKHAKELTERFAKWYYVIPADAYAKVRLTRADLVKKKAAEPPKEPPQVPPKKDGGK